MPPAEAPTLGLASIDRLRELREATESRRAAEGRQILDLAIDEVHPDPHQVRRDFAGDVVEAEDAEELEGLARNVASIGVQSPIRVRRDPEGGFVIVYGERRWRAARLAGLATVPCLLVAEDDFDPKRNTLAQLAENLQRKNLRLIDVIRAVERCLEESGLTATELGRQLGKSKQWVSKHVTLGRATGAQAEALAEGWLPNYETARLFGRLDPATQERLLARARRDAEPVSYVEVARLDRRGRKGESERGPQARAHTAAPEPGAAAGASEGAIGGDAERTHVLELTTSELRLLVARLGGDPGEARPLVDVLRGLLATETIR